MHSFATRLFFFFLFFWGAGFCRDIYTASPMLPETLGRDGSCTVLTWHTCPSWVACFSLSRTHLAPFLPCKPLPAYAPWAACFAPTCTPNYHLSVQPLTAQSPFRAFVVVIPTPFTISFLSNHSLSLNWRAAGAAGAVRAAGGSGARRLSWLAGLRRHVQARDVHHQIIYSALLLFNCNHDRGGVWRYLSDGMVG